MSGPTRLQNLAASATACLLVAWVGGTVGAAGFKSLYWLVFGLWPQTAVQALLPDSAIRAVLALPADDLGGAALDILIRLDILTLILAGPPLVLLPCLAILLAGRQPIPVVLRRRHPFATPRAPNRGTDAPNRRAESTSSGSPAASPP